MFGDDLDSFDGSSNLDEEQERAPSVIPEFTVALMSTLLWSGPYYDSDRDRWVLRASLVHPETGKTIIIDRLDKAQKSLLLDFTTACASYYHDYQADVSEDGAVTMVHVFPRGIKYFL